MQKLTHITDEQWSDVCDFNRNMLNDFLVNSVELSPKTLKAYESNLKIWFVWVSENLKNKEQVSITSLEYKRFQNWLVLRGASSSDVSSKRAAVSTLNNYIELYYQSDYPVFRNFINKSIKKPPANFVHPKEPLTKSEFRNLVETLKKRGDWQKVAYLLFTFTTGCRRAESRQVLKSIIEATPITKQKSFVDENGDETIETMVIYRSHDIRCKGRSQTGKVRKLTFDQETMDAFNQWLSIRGADDCPYMFVTKQDGKYEQVSETCFNSWAKSTFEPIVGRRFHPHLLRESRATQAVIEDGKDINSVKNLLGHESSETTEIYVIRNDEDDVDELF